MAVPLGLLGAQLSIAGAIIFQTHRSTGNGSDSIGGFMVMVGILIGVAAVFACRTRKESDA